jgi:hypothetical protein
MGTDLLSGPGGLAAHLRATLYYDRRILAQAAAGTGAWPVVNRRQCQIIRSVVAVVR